jgi:Ni/Co efflux regulator RcnB
MKKKIILSVLIAAYVAAIGPVSAQEHHDDRGPQDHGYQQDNHGGDNRGHDNYNNDHGDRRNDRNDYHAVDNHGGGHDRGAGPRHDMYKGGRLPSEYRSRQYVVDDWRGHHLSAPPRGYHWVQTGNDYVLAAVATGVIASLLLNN